jgi:hypothetical protein
MPGWGTGSFENDDAQAFLTALASKAPSELKEILARADQEDYLQAPDASAVIAAAEVVASAKGSPSNAAPKQIQDWISNIEGAPSEEMIELACRAVDKVRMNSELKDLWLQAEGLNEWSASLRDLEERLRNGAR